MTIPSNNFDIYNVINKASAQDKATIFFDGLLRLSISNKESLNTQELEALGDSFQTNEERHLFDRLMHQCSYCIMSIFQIEKYIAVADFFECQVKLCRCEQDDKYFVEYVISDSLKELENGKYVSDKKEVRKIFKKLQNRIKDHSFLNISEKSIKRLVDGFYNPKDEEKEPDFYEEKFWQFFKDQINNKADIAQQLIGQFQDSYKDFDNKFEPVDKKLKRLEEKIKKLKNYANII
jgi:6-pyruvoyl-tetrahydropterin synthase